MTPERIHINGLSGLRLDDQATFRIGQIARESVHMESVARAIHGRIRDARPGTQGPPDTFASLVGAIRGLIRALDGFAWTRQAEAALTEAKTAYRERNRYVHDILAHGFEGVWIRSDVRDLQAVRPVVELSADDLADAVTALQRCTWRLTGLEAMLAQHLDASTAPRDYVDFGGAWEGFLLGEFQLTEGGGARLTDW